MKPLKSLSPCTSSCGLEKKLLKKAPYCSYITPIVTISMLRQWNASFLRTLLSSTFNFSIGKIFIMNFENIFFVLSNICEKSLGDIWRTIDSLRLIRSEKRKFKVFFFIFVSNSFVRKGHQNIKWWKADRRSNVCQRCLNRVKTIDKKPSKFRISFFVQLPSKVSMSKLDDESKSFSN